MSARAFLGMLTHLDPRAPGQTMLVTVALPRGEYDAASKALGKPDPVSGSNVALLPCRRPDRPLGDDDALLLAALDLVNECLANGIVRLTPEILQQFGVLDTLLPRSGRRRDITAPPPARPGAL